MSQKRPQRGLSSLEPAIKRLAIAMGVVRIGKDALEELVNYIDDYLTSISGKLETLAEYENVKTIKFDHVKYMVPDLSKMRNEPCRGKDFKIYKDVGTMPGAYNYETGGRKKGEYYMADCHFLTKAVMARKIKSLLSIRISPDAIDAIIDIVQIMLISVIETAGTITNHTGRITMNARDISIAMSAMKKCI